MKIDFTKEITGAWSLPNFKGRKKVITKVRVKVTGTDPKGNTKSVTVPKVFDIEDLDEKTFIKNPKEDQVLDWVDTTSAEEQIYESLSISPERKKEREERNIVEKYEFPE